ncbi:heat-shock protein [Methanohalophilus halophilus]|nr:heat-shock protein [Methanohalophilus halophilus]APH39904.1 heat-shock protein [Methanohalophilus halophilus]
MDLEMSENPFIQALLISFAMAIFMVGMAMGIMQIVTTGSNPVPYAIILLVFAVIFILGSVFFEKRGADELGSIAGAALVSSVSTFSIISFLGGLSFAFNDGLFSIGWNRLVSALAICMIVSMLVVKFFSYRIQNQYS